MRAMSRRTSRTRDVFSSWPVARWKRRLNRSFLSFSNSSSSWSTVMALRSSGLSMAAFLLGDARHEARLDRQLGGGERERLPGELDRDAVDLEQDSARLHPRDPEFRGALARAHAHFERLLRHRHVGEDANPHPPGALHVTRHGAPRRLDLTRGDAIRLQRLEPVLAEGQRGAAGRNAVDAALVRLAELRLRRLQHGFAPFLNSLRSRRLRRRDAAGP